MRKARSPPRWRRDKMAWIVFRQTIVMGLYMAAGFALFRAGKLTARGSRELGAMLLWVVIPAVVLNSFCVDFTPERLIKLVESTLLGALVLLLALLLGRALFRSAPVDSFAAAFSNAGFIGIPLVQASIGPEAVFYLVGLIATVNLLQWTCAARALTGERQSGGLRRALLNPVVLAIALGLLLFVTGAGTRLPVVLSTALGGISAMNAPLAMLMLGTYLAQSDLKEMLRNLRVYQVCAARLLFIPLVTLVVFRFLPLPRDMLLALLIAAGAPVGANVAVYVQLYGLDYAHACQTIALSTLLSVFTLPLLLLAAGWIL